jgi:hypothetical protein
MRRLFGTRVLGPGGRASAKRGGQRLPSHGEKLLYCWWRGYLLLMWWKSHQGYRPLALVSPQGPEYETLETWFLPGEQVAIKKRAVASGPVILPMLGMDSKVLGKCPALIEFITATAYEDGAPRQPGYFTVRNRTIEFEITLYDPDAGQRVVIRARELDKMFVGAEAVLNAVDAPWEPDLYLMGRLPKKKKK